MDKTRVPKYSEVTEKRFFFFNWRDPLEGYNDLISELFLSPDRFRTTVIYVSVFISSFFMSIFAKYILRFAEHDLADNSNILYCKYIIS